MTRILSVDKHEWIRRTAKFDNGESISITFSFRGATLSVKKKDSTPQLPLKAVLKWTDLQSKETYGQAAERTAKAMEAATSLTEFCTTVTTPKGK